MTCIKCRLSSYLFFSDSRLLFNKSLTSTALWTLQEYVRNWSLCVPLRAELNAIVRKLIPLICFDIFQSNRNALIANTFFGTPIKAFRYHFDWKMSKLISLICFDIFQSKWHRNALIANAIFGTPNKRQRINTISAGHTYQSVTNWLCFAARRSEDSPTQRLHHVHDGFAPIFVLHCLCAVCWMLSYSSVFT